MTPSFGLRAVVAADEADAGKLHVELVGDDLRQRGEDALTDLDLAGRDLDDAIEREPEPLRQARVGAQVAGEQDRALGRGRGGRVRGGAHAGCPAFAARSTARTMRLWAPQRQRFRSSAARTSASLGSGLRRSSAAALIRMPEMQ